MVRSDNRESNDVPRDRRRLQTLVAACAVIALGGVVLVATGDGGESNAFGVVDGHTVANDGDVETDGDSDADGPQGATRARPATTAAAAAPSGSEATMGSEPADETEDLAMTEQVGEDPPADGDCVLSSFDSLRLNDSGDDVECLQSALADAGAYDGPVNGQFDSATFNAVSNFQTAQDLFVDGVAGRETGLELGIWPPEDMFVERTPPPPPGSMDSWGYALSSVSSTTKNAPDLPADSGSGYRVVYERASQRVWAVDSNEVVIRSWLVSGSQYQNEVPGTHYVYSRSEVSTAWNGRAYLPYMIRWLRTERGHIGFHGIPTHVSDGSAYQTEADLGTRLSGGCQRQSNPDALFLWNFADVGTKVVVL